MSRAAANISREWNEGGDYKVAVMAFLADVEKCIDEMAPWGWKPGISSNVRFYNLPGASVSWELRHTASSEEAIFSIPFDDFGRFSGGVTVYTNEHGVVWPPRGGLLQGWPNFFQCFRMHPTVQLMVRRYAVFHSEAGKERILGKLNG